MEVKRITVIKFRVGDGDANGESCCGYSKVNEYEDSTVNSHACQRQQQPRVPCLSVKQLEVNFHEIFGSVVWVSHRTRNNPPDCGTDLVELRPKRPQTKTATCQTKTATLKIQNGHKPWSLDR